MAHAEILATLGIHTNEAGRLREMGTEHSRTRRERSSHSFKWKSLGGGRSVSLIKRLKEEEEGRDVSLFKASRQTVHLLHLSPNLPL